MLIGIEDLDKTAQTLSNTKEAQEASQEEFQTALERLSTLINFDGGELQAVYEQLNDDYESSKAAAEEVSDNINAVEQVANDLFDEWRSELYEYQNANMRRQSERTLKDTERQFTRLLVSMRRSEAKMQPVLASLQDNVLYLKHNLNARAIAAIKGEFGNLKRDIQRLIKDMNQSIADSNKFIEQMNQS